MVGPGPATPNRGLGRSTSSSASWTAGRATSIRSTPSRRWPSTRAKPIGEQAVSKLSQSTAGRVWLGSPWQFRQRGQSGLWVSDLFPHIAGLADELCVVRSLVGEQPLHGQQNLLLHTGRVTGQAPSFGSWVSYGLGTENDRPARLRAAEQRLDSQRRLRELSPARSCRPRTAATMLRAKGTPVDNIVPARSARPCSGASSTCCARRIRRSPQRLPNDTAIEVGHPQLRDGLPHAGGGPARGRRRAAKRQATRKLYGLDSTNEYQQYYALQCLRARRLVEAGVRFVEITCPLTHANNSPWDQHGNLKKYHEENALITDQAVAALITDLKQRGLLDETIVLWAGEMGRTPHTPRISDTLAATITSTATRIFLAGGGIRGGMAFGATDEFGNCSRREPADDPRHPRHDPASARARPRAADVPLRRPRRQPDRRPRPRRPRDSGVTKINDAEVWRIAALISAPLIVLLANLLGPACFQQTESLSLAMYGGYLAAGGLVAQPCLLAQWAGFGSQSIMLRWPITWGSLIVVTCAFLQGLQLSLRGQFRPLPMDVVIVVWLASLMTFCIVQTPLWILRGAFGWRIELPDAIQKHAAKRPLQFDLKYLLVLTAVIGALLALIRQSLPELPNNRDWWPVIGVFLEVAPFIFVIAALCATLFLPCLWVALLDNPSWSLLWLGATLALEPIGILELAAIAFGSFGSATANGRMLACMYAFVFGLTLTALGCLLITRALGYRLVSRNKVTPVPEGDVTATH